MKDIKLLSEMIKKSFFQNRNIVWICILEAFLAALKTYIPLLLLTPLLNGFMKKSSSDVLKYGLLYLALKYGLEMFHQFVQSRRVIEGRKENERNINNFYHKITKIPYERMTENEFKIKASSAAEELYYEFDYSDIIDYSVRILSDVVSVIFSVILILSLIFAQPKSSHTLLNVVTNPIFSFAVLFGCIAGAFFLNLKKGKRNVEKINELSREHYKIENRLMYLQNQIIYRFSSYINYYVYKMQEFLKRRIEENTRENIAFFMSVRKIGLKNGLRNSSFYGCIIIISYLFTLLKIVSGAVGKSSFLTYSSGMISLYTAGMDIQNKFEFMKRAYPYFVNIEEIMNEKEEPDAGIELFDNQKFVLKFEHVSYKYPNSGSYALKDINVTLERGKKYALVGENGAGKSTMLALICRILTPTSGVITLNGKNIEAYDLKQYRKIFAAVFQEISLYPCSLLQNITGTVKYPEQEKFNEVLKKAGWGEGERNQKEFFEEYEENRNYSGGEKQKIAVAKAFYRDGMVYLMDEPSSALDPVSEVNLYQNLLRQSLAKTVLFVSHKLSFCRDSDVIIVLVDGEMIECGSHGELMEKTGVYYSLWNTQAEIYN